MKLVRKTTRAQSLLICLNLLVLFVILFHLNFAHGSVQKSVDNNLNSIVESNYMSYLKSLDVLDVLNPTNQDLQKSQDLSNDSAIVLSNNLGHSQYPKIVTNGSYVYTLWIDDTQGNRDIYFKRSDDNGISFGKTINLSDNPGGSLNPTMAASKTTGNLYVVWEHIPGNDGEIFFTRSTDNGEKFDSPVIIGNNTGLNGFPQVAVSESSTNVYVVWQDAQNGIMLRRSTDGGSTFETAIKLGNKNLDSQNPQTAVSKDNNVYVAWQSNPQGSNGSIVFTRSIDKGKSFENPITIGKDDDDGYSRVNTTEKKTDRKGQNIQLFQPRIVTAPGTNEVYVVWHNGFNTFHKSYHLLTDIFFSRSTDNGATFENPISLTNYSVWAKSTDNGAIFENPISLSGYSGWILDPQIAVSQHNNVYVAWQRNPQDGNGEIVFTKSTDNGESFENPITISDKNGNSQNPQVVVSEDNNVFLVWDNNATGNEEIILHRVNPKNMPLISSKLINNDTGSQNNITTINVPANNPKRIALLERTFTDAAYNNAFYLFYNTKRDTTSNITKYTNLLSSKVTNQYSILPEFEVIANHLKWLTPQSNITILTDADAHESSSLFMDNGTIKYDAVILGHNEYVTQLEYSNLRQYVANGGVLILLDGNVFYAEVKYDKKTQTITLVKGHRWDFDGTFASTSVDERWANETTEWLGSNYCECWGVDNIRFANNPFGVRHNEEQYITNPNAKIILDYQAYDVGKTKFLPSDFKIATYELDYKKGKVITLGLYTDDLLFHNDKFRQFFDSLLYYYVFSDLN